MSEDSVFLIISSTVTLYPLSKKLFLRKSTILLVFIFESLMLKSLITFLLVSKIINAELKFSEFSLLSAQR